MSILRLQLQGTESIAAAAIAVEVVNVDLETVAELSLSGHEQREIEVEPGKYLIRASLPSGEMIKTKASVADNEQKEVVLHPPAAAHAWLKWQHFLGNAAPSQSRSLSMYQSTWLRLWTYHNRRWSIHALPLQESGQDSTAINYRLDVSEAETQQLRLLQLGGTQVPWRFMALPPTSRLEVLIQPTQSGAETDGALAMAIASHNWNAETLLRYITAGNLESANIVSKDVANAEALLAEKLTNPMGATIAGYYLLRIGAIERLQQWAAHFANQFNWLPDALIIHAWQLLQQPQPHLELAEQRLLQAADRGIPVYSRGLRLLFDGLQLFQKQPSVRPELDRAIAAAIKTVQPYAAAVHWAQPLTLFHGETPDHPSLSAPIGIPNNPTEIFWLPSPERISAATLSPKNTQTTAQPLFQAPSVPSPPASDQPSIHSDNCLSVVDLSQWLPNLVDGAWQTLKDVFGMERAGLVFAFRNAPVQSGIIRAKTIDLKQEETEVSVVLVVEFVPSESGLTQGSATVRLQVHPAQNQPFLPPNLQLSVIDRETEEVILQTQSNAADNRMQLELNGAVGDGFRVEMKLNQAVAIERFVI